MGVRRISQSLVFSALALACASGCTTYRDELSRAQSAYDANEHETALALTRAIDPDVPWLSKPEQVRYYYLRGMTNFRVGFKAEARHYLAIAKSMDAEYSALQADAKIRLDETLSGLNTEVHQNGLASLSAHDAELSAKKPKKK